MTPTRARVELDYPIAVPDPAAAPANRPRVLIVEDSPGLGKLYSTYLESENIQTLLAGTGQEALKYLDQTPLDLLLVDLFLPDMQGMAILRQVQDRALPTLVVIITGHGSVAAAVDAMRHGARDFLEKPFDAQRLRTTVRNALEHQRLTSLIDTYQQQFDRDRFHGFVGNSLPMQMVYRVIEACASSSATLFITGESGTGKEVCADAIHRHGSRKDGPFVALNCGAIPTELIESELFGHRRGAFTGAVQDRVGAIRRAHRGTLFLDEIGEMHQEAQTKLLRFVQTGRFQMVGGSAEEQVDVRIVCATNRDPWREVKLGRFREDLYYRLHVVPIQLPPLRDRGGDILLLANYFLQRYAREEGKSFRGFEPGVAAVLNAYDWPGNVRQLQNVVRNVTVLQDGEWVTLAHLPPPLNQVSPALVAPQPEPAKAIAPPLSKGSSPPIRPLADVERDAIEQALAWCDGNVPQAAALLQIHPSTLYRRKLAWTKS